MKKILVPTDFSEHANNALRYAINIGNYFEAEIELPAKDISPESAPVVKTMSDSIKTAIGISITAAAVVAVAFLM